MESTSTVNIESETLDAGALTSLGLSIGAVLD